MRLNMASERRLAMISALGRLRTLLSLILQYEAAGRSEDQEGDERELASTAARRGEMEALVRRIDESFEAHSILRSSGEGGNGGGLLDQAVEEEEDTVGLLSLLLGETLADFDDVYLRCSLTRS